MALFQKEDNPLPHKVLHLLCHCLTVCPDNIKPSHNATYCFKGIPNKKFNLKITYKLKMYRRKQLASKERNMNFRYTTNSFLNQIG